MKGVKITVKDIKEEQARLGCSLTMARRNILRLEIKRMIQEACDIEDVKQILHEMIGRI